MQVPDGRVTGEVSVATTTGPGERSALPWRASDLGE